MTIESVSKPAEKSRAKSAARAAVKLEAMNRLKPFVVKPEHKDHFATRRAALASAAARSTQRKKMAAKKADADESQNLSTVFASAVGGGTIGSVFGLVGVIVGAAVGGGIGMFVKHAHD